MGCSVSVPEKDMEELSEEKRIDAAIEQQLRRSRQNEKNQIKLLLLGPGESGKSTVLKQMKLMHKGGFVEQERMQYAQVIWADVLQSMKLLIIQARKLRIPLDCDQPNSLLIRCKQLVLRANALDQIDAGTAGGTHFLNDYVFKYSEGPKKMRQMRSTGQANGLDWNDEKVEEGPDLENIASGLQNLSVTQKQSSEGRQQLAEAVTRLWKEDGGIRRCYGRSNEFQLETSVGYYFDNIAKFADENYRCSDTDILRGRIKTTGITETSFNINSFKFKVLDAGGQRLERKKWIHCFDNITAVLFVLAISEYDQKLFEDERVNRMNESIVLFDSLCNSRWFANTPFILFLNKIDLFESKLARSPLKKYFPNYQGKPTDVDEAIRFFEKLFLSLNATSKSIYVHRTCATDARSMNFVLSAVTDMIVQQNLLRSGII